MRVLVLESDRHAADAAVRRLAAAGHDVVRCHEPDHGSFPCNGLCDGACPLDDPRGVDVALAYRAHPYPTPTGYEDGVSCALRRGVPLVVGGTAVLNPYEDWTSAVADDDEDIVDVCEVAARGPIERLAAPAREELRRRLAAQPEVAARADVDVRRQERALAAVITLPAEAMPLRGQLAVAVEGVLSHADRDAKRIDIAIHEAV